MPVRMVQINKLGMLPNELYISIAKAVYLDAISMT